MPSRVLVGEAIWGSDKIARCSKKMPATVGVYYPWFYCLADANGSFELTNPRAIYAKVAVNLPFLTERHVVEILGEFEKEGLLFTWEANGKRYGHWTGSNSRGRLPPENHRERYEQLATPVPKEELERYQSTYGRGVKTFSRTHPHNVGKTSGDESGPVQDRVLVSVLVKDREGVLEREPYAAADIGAAPETHKKSTKAPSHLSQKNEGENHAQRRARENREASQRALRNIREGR